MYTSRSGVGSVRSSCSRQQAAILNPRSSLSTNTTGLNRLGKHSLERGSEQEMLRPLKKTKASGVLSSSNIVNTAGPISGQNKKLPKRSKTMGIVKADYSHIKSKVDHRRVSIQPNDSGMALDDSLDLEPIIPQGKVLLKTQTESKVVHVKRVSASKIVDENTLPILKRVAEAPPQRAKALELLKPKPLATVKPIAKPIAATSRSKLQTTVSSKPVPSTPQSKKQDVLNVSFSSIKNPFKFKKSKKVPFFDPLLVEEYDQEIYEYWRELELDLRVDSNYMARQPEVEWEMRHTLISWLVQLHAQFKMNPETLHLTIHLIDRTMTHKVISVNKLQLVGVSALLVAAKFEEIMAPSVQDLSYFTDFAYSGEEIVRAERHLLGIVMYQLGMPSPLQFLKRMIKGNTDARLWNLCCYFIEMLLLDHRCLQYVPSYLAASALFLTIKVLYDGEWVQSINQTPQIIKLIGYKEQDLLDCVYGLLNFLKTAETTTIYDKYATSHYCYVSKNMLLFMKQKNML
jgi:G2/mitotic-specific cyclin 1/2